MTTDPLTQLRTSAATLTSRFNRPRPIGEPHFKVHPDIFATLQLDIRQGNYGYRSGWILIESDPAVEQHHVTPANDAAEHMARLNSPEALGRMLGLVV